MSVLLALLTTTAGAIEVTTEGPCPGAVDITVTGATAGGRVALLTAHDAGEALIPGGVCAGTPTLLDPGSLALRGVLTDSDADGTVVAGPTVPAPFCGDALQAVDVTTCEVSDLAVLPDAEPVDAVMIAANSSGGATGLWAIDPIAGTAVRISDPGVPITALTFDDVGVVYAMEGGANSAVRNPTYGRISTVDLDTGELTLVADTFQKESSLTWAGGLLYAADEYSEYASIDPVTGRIVVLGARPDGVGFGYDLAWDGDTMWRVSDTALYRLDEFGVAELVSEVTGLPGGYGGGATMHEGELWVAVDDGAGGTALVTVDPATGVATPTGIVIPDGRVDALASRVP